MAEKARKKIERFWKRWRVEVGEAEPLVG